MELLAILAAFAVLFLLCAFLTLKCNLPAALSPLVGLSCIAAWLTACGIADLLFPGIILLYAACVVLGAWALLCPAKAKGPGAATAQTLFTPGAVLFWALALSFAVYFFIRRPVAFDYDEMSLWATAVKLTKTDNRLYATAVLGTPWAATQNPGLPLISYFFQFFGHYADWKVYAAYDALAFAVFAAVAGNLKFKQYRIVVPLAAVLWCVPYFFTTYNHTIYLNTTYLSSYGDIPAGLVMGGAVAVWLALRQHAKSPKWAVLPVLALAANLKANTFVMALVAAGLVAVDAWLFPPEPPFKHRLLRRTGFAGACMAAPMAIYYFWNVRYVGQLVAKNAEAGGLGETSAPLSGVVFNGVKVLLGQPVEGFYEERRPQFLQAIADMGTQFFTGAGRMSMIGHGLLIVALILAVFAAAILVGQKGQRIRIAVLALLSTVCFAGYNLMLALSYGFIFKPEQAQNLYDYNRYIYSYYIGWFIIALACLVLALQRKKRLQESTLPHRLLPLLGQGVLLGMAAVMLLRTSQLVLPQLSVLGFSDSEFTDRRTAMAEAAEVTGHLQPEDRVFYVSQGDNGLGWFEAVYDFYPIIVDYSGATNNGGGGTFGLGSLRPTQEGAEQYYFHPYTVAAFGQAVRESGCNYLYLQRVDDIFVQSYADLFTDALSQALAGTTVLYKVTDAGFAPVEMQGVAK